MGTHSRLAPLVLFLAATGWCVWPYLSSRSPAAPKRAESASLDARMLRPGFEPASERNPFQRPKRRTETAPEPKVERTVAASPPKVEPKRETRPLAPAARPSAKASKPPTPEGLSLGGTLVRGKNRAAIINGKVYRQGEILDHEPGARVHWKLAEVRADGVVLSPKSGGRPAFLAFVGPGEAGKVTAARPGSDTLAKEPGEKGSIPEEISLESSALERLAKISGGDVTQTYRNLWRLAVDPSVRQEWLGQGPRRGPDLTERD